MSYAELWSSMGPFAKGIVVVMFIMSAWSWAVSISKFLYLRKSQKETRKFAPEFSRYLQEEQLDGAIALAEKNKKSHVARVLGEALAEVKPLLRDRATITAADINSAERAVESFGEGIVRLENDPLVAVVEKQSELAGYLLSDIADQRGAGKSSDLVFSKQSDGPVNSKAADLQFSDAADAGGNLSAGAADPNRFDSR